MSKVMGVSALVFHFNLFLFFPFYFCSFLKNSLSVVNLVLLLSGKQYRL